MEGIAGTALLEPFVYAAHQGLQDDYKALDSILNIGFGGVLGGGLHVLGGAARDVLQPGRWKTAAELERALAARKIDIESTNRAIAAHYTDEAGIIRAQSDERASALDRIFEESDRIAAEARTARENMRAAQGLPVEPRETTAARVVQALEHNRERLNEIADKPAFLRTADEKVLLEAQGGTAALTPELKAAAETPEIQRAVEITQKPPFLRTPEERVFLSGLRGDNAPLPSGEPRPVALPTRPLPARATVRTADHATRETALRTAVAQAADGRTIEVEPLFNAAADLASAIRRQGAPEAERLTGGAETVQMPARLATDLKAAEADLSAALADLESRWAATGRDPAELKALMPEVEALARDAEALERAARAAGLCDLE